MKIAAAYIRVSTDDQIEYSPESQLKLIRNYAKRNNILVPNEYVFVDEGISGRRADKRPEFMRMIGVAKSKPKTFEYIIVWKFSRFARNREDSIVYKSMLKKQCGIEVLSVSEQLSDDKTSILIEALLEAMDEYYSINLGEEVKRGMTEKASRGEPLSIPPFGYCIKDKKFYVDEKEAVIVKKIFNDFAAGKGYRELATELNNLGIKTHRGNNIENRTIEYILNNPVYIGKIRWNPEGKTRRNFKSNDIMVVDGHHEAIIDPETWSAAQNRIEDMRKMYRKSDRQQTFTNIFQGLVRCSSCGATLVKAHPTSLQCQQYAKGRCNVSHSITFKKLEQSVIDMLKHELNEGSIRITRKTFDDTDMSAILKQQIKKEKEKLNRVREAYEQGIDTLEEYKTNKERINKTIEQLSGQLGAIKEPTQEEMLKAFRERTKKLIAILEDKNATPNEKNKALRYCIDKIIFNKNTSELEIYYYI